MVDMTADDGGGRLKRVPIDLPSNSKKSKEEEAKAAERKIEKVITGNVVKKQKSLWREIRETFTGDDIGSVGNFLLFDVIIPAAKNAILESVNLGSHRLLGGDEVRRPYGYNSSKPNTSRIGYNTISYKEPARDISHRGRAVHDFDEVVLETRGEAEMVIDGMNEQISEFGLATVADLYDFLGLTSSFTDQNYGWKDLRDATPVRLRSGGYLLSLPKPRPIDK